MGRGGGRCLLEKLGCEVIPLNIEPTGLFAHTPEPTAENLTDLCHEVKQHKADIGFEIRRRPAGYCRSAGALYRRRIYTGAGGQICLQQAAVRLRPIFQLLA